jgi:rsbT co-antagonist protein RsbR
METRVDYLARKLIDEKELQRRRAFYEIADEDLRRLAALKPFGERHGEAIVESLYELLLGHPDSRQFFADEVVIRRVKQLQRQYFLGLFSGKCDMRYVEDRLRVGAAHERIGLDPKWYIGAYARYMRLLHQRLLAEFPPAEAQTAFESLTKVVSFDMALAMDAYIAANLDTLARHQAAIRELSTPVIRVHDRVLLLPLVGAVDTHRAQQFMETILTRTSEEQAKVVIIDIAGVPVIDTKVADHLLKTTAAVKLLGADTVLTGISAQVARTMVQIGVDLSSMQTCSRLAEGLEIALNKVGRGIQELDDK